MRGCVMGAEREMGHRRSFYPLTRRGDIVYLVATDSRGVISRVDVRDPSFLNWTALSYAAVRNVVPDFPLINKSFNLSYSGNDL